MLAGLGITLELEGFVVGRVVELPVVGNGVIDDGVIDDGDVEVVALLEAPINKYLST